MNLLTNLHDSIFSLYMYIYTHTRTNILCILKSTHAPELAYEYIILFQLVNSRAN